MSALERILKLAEVLHKTNEKEYYRSIALFDGYIKRCAHYEPKNDGTTPNPWRRNMDYSGWENSPYFGSMTEFMKKFPGGIEDWRKWKEKTKKQRFKKWDIKKSKKRKAELEQLMKQAEGKFSGYAGSIEKDTLKNKSFRKVIFTGKNEQLVLMTLRGGEDIGEETHKNVDQFFRIEAGEAIFELNGSKKKIGDGGAVLVPAGTIHNVTNASDSELLQLYTIYSPPNHPDGEIQKTKKEATEEEEQKDHKMKIQKTRERRAKLEQLLRHAEDETPDVVDVSDLPDTGTSPERRKEFQHAIADIEESKLTPEELDALLRVLKSQEKPQNAKDKPSFSSLEDLSRSLHLMSNEELLSLKDKLDEILQKNEETLNPKETEYKPTPLEEFDFADDSSKRAHYEPETLEFVKLTGPKEWLKSVKDFIQKRKKKEQSAEDAAYEAARDFVEYYKLLLKRKNNGKA